jgi:NADPH:quinone reductase-like Zn-dependent oxidoreductase
MAERIVIARIGGPEVLEMRSFEPESPGPGEVAIDVRAVGLNFADVFSRLGLYSAAPRRPFTPGFEVSGEVVETGSDVSGFSPGDRVVAVTRFGGYTSRLNVDAAWARPLPHGWSFEEGAAFSVTYLTAYHGLVHLGQLRPEETVVVHSAAGGVGTAACQIARALGARVIGTVGSPEKRKVAHDAGAHAVVVSARYKVWRHVRKLTDGEGVDVILDAVGGRNLRRGYRALRPGGRLISYGFAEMMPQGGRRNWPLLVWRMLRTPRFAPMDLVLKNRTVAGFNLAHCFHRQDLFSSAAESLYDWARAGTIRPVVGASFPFDRAPDAQRFLQSRSSTGKVILVRPGPSATGTANRPEAGAPASTG